MSPLTLPAFRRKQQIQQRFNVILCCRSFICTAAEPSGGRTEGREGSHLNTKGTFASNGQKIRLRWSVSSKKEETVLI